MPAPIALFAYKRVRELQRTLESLQANYLAKESELYVFVDGPKNRNDLNKVNEVRQLVKKITGFLDIHININDQNNGCASSIINGVSIVLQKHSSIIVIEDDIITTPNFLDFVNQGLNKYKHTERVFSIGGYTFPFIQPDNYSDDVYFYGRTCAWGWGIWADRWFKTDWEIKDYKEFMMDRHQRNAFNYYGNDRVRMLKKTVNKEIDAWDIKLCYNQFKQKGLTVYPTVSKVNNIGFYSTDGVNTNVYNRYRTILDKGIKRDFTMPDKISEHSEFTKQFRSKFSIGIRLLNRLKTYAGMR